MCRRCRSWAQQCSHADDIAHLSCFCGVVGWGPLLNSARAKHVHCTEARCCCLLKSHHRESHAGIDRAKSFAAQRHARAVVSRAFSCLLTTHIDVIGFRVPRSFPKCPGMHTGTITHTNAPQYETHTHACACLVCSRSSAPAHPHLLVHPHSSARSFAPAPLLALLADFHPCTSCSVRARESQ